MDDLQAGKSYAVNTENGLDLRREPNMNPKTEDGNDNVVLSMPSGSAVVLESVEVRTNDGHSWYNVRYIQDETYETGWVDSGSLQEIDLIIPVTGGSGSYRFKFAGSEYSISDENLTNSVGQYIDVQPRSNMQKFSINGAPYYTTLENINSMKNAGLVNELR